MGAACLTQHMGLSGRKQGRALRATAGCGAPSAQESRLGHGASKTDLQKQAQGSKEEPSCSLPSQLGLHQRGVTCSAGHLPTTVET